VCHPGVGRAGDPRKTVTPKRAAQRERHGLSRLIAACSTAPLCRRHVLRWAFWCARSFWCYGEDSVAEFPALPIFTDAYLADTRHLTAEEHGAYLLLLMCAWRTRGCALKDDDRFLARSVGVTLPRWRRLRPVIADFFAIEDGLWRQKKLTEVYKGVESRVARNRANGAKGGRAKAARKAGDRQAVATPKKLATKTRIQTPEPEAADVPLKDIAAAAGLDLIGVDSSEPAKWQAAGAELSRDILPTIERLRAREVARTGRVRGSLAYYGAAILEARDKRLKAVGVGKAHSKAFPAPPPKRQFDPSSPADWRLFLGDSSSRFRGDYLARHWRIGADHPVFLPRSLGSDPTVKPNNTIPEAITAEYGPLWGWVLPQDNKQPS